ncbi:hypothetical protein ABID42_003452 [Arcicella rosea]|uniref:hypothetical protein n=1 Tax=Arcicella rosea TaxID=502909 RepID=UPI00345D4D0B
MKSTTLGITKTITKNTRSTTKLSHISELAETIKINRMDNETLKNIPLTTILLTYLFVCGILYLIGYWSTFDIDVFSLISIYDIPKSFAFPLLISQGFFVLNVITGNTINLNDDREDISHFITLKKEWGNFKRIPLGMLTSINLWLTAILCGMIVYIPNYKENEIFWIISSFVVAYYLLHRFINHGIVKNKIKNRVARYFVGHFLIFFPISCLSTGKLTSLKILHNRESKYVSIVNIKSAVITSDTTRLKLLGFISDRIIYSTLDNKKIFIINKESCDGIILTK